MTDAIQEVDIDQVQKETKETLLKVTQDAVAATGETANSALLGTGKALKGATDAIKDVNQDDVKEALTQTSNQYKMNVMSGWNSLSEDYVKGAAKNQKRAADILSGSAASIAGAAGSVSDKLAPATAELVKDVTTGSARYAEVASALTEAVKSVDVDGLQAATKEELSKAATDFASSTTEATKVAAAKAADIVARSTELATTAASETVEQVTSAGGVALAPDLDTKLAKLREAGNAQLQMSQAELERGFASQSTKIQATLSKVEVPPVSLDTSALSVALGNVASQAGAKVSDATISTLTAAQQAAVAKQAEVERNIQKTDFSERYSKAKSDAEELKRKIETKEIVDDVASALAPLANVPVSLKEVADAVPVDEIISATSQATSAITKTGAELSKAASSLQGR